LDDVSDLTLMRAQGKVVALIAAMLQGAGIQPMDEFANLLGLFAATVAEDDEDEGHILAYWAALVRDGVPAGSERRF
jgi:hypothetical protein